MLKINSNQQFSFAKRFLMFILKLLSQATLWRYKPQIIGITGSVGKTSAKEAIFAALKGKYNVRRNIKNYNNEVGVPLTILGQESGESSLFDWLKIILISFWGIIYTRNYPNVLVLEMGADRMGDISYLVDFIKCHIAVITAIGETPAHIEFFRNINQVVKEKASLVRSLYETGWAVLNCDDEKVKTMAQQTNGHIFFYGFGEKADLRACNFEQNLENLENAGITFQVDYQSENILVKISKTLGKHQVYSILSAIAAGILFKMNLQEIVKNLKNYTPPLGRLCLVKGIKNTLIIDDTYNSSPSSVAAALDVLAQAKSERKIAALGEMLELGAFTEQAHREIGLKAAGVADILIAVGERSIFMADEAKKNGFPIENLMYFASSEEAGRALQNILREGDVVLAKGSQGVRMEKIVKEIMAEPEKARELLVRQEEKWL